jgi:hypothetical protein
MADDAVVRARARDWLAVGAIALVLLVGLVHFGRDLSAPAPAPSAGGAAVSASAEPTPTTSTPTPQARLDNSPTSAPAEPTPGPNPGTCWDGRATSSLSLCGLPHGTRGLAWVFPSLDPDRSSCRPARASDGRPAYAVVTSYICFERALGQPVTVTYDEVADVHEVEAWMDDQVGAANVVDLPGAHGGRCLMVDTDQRPARISGMYERYPYVVSVFAPTKNAALRAWKQMVEQRPSGAVLGTRA